MKVKIVLLLAIWMSLGIFHVRAKLTFRNFQTKHNKTYLSSTELSLREQIFISNLDKIEEHNKKYQQGLVSYKMGINQFSDLSDEEFSSKFKTQILDYDNNILLKNVKTQDSSQLKVDKLPESIDWRDHGIVTAVKDQKNCGGCWAFSATGTIEGQLALKYGNLTSLSEQQLLDCDRHNNACSGGVVQYALYYVSENGITTEEEYSYNGYKGFCDRGKTVAAGLESYVNILQFNETDLKVAVGLIGPVSVAVNADPIQHYESGVFDSTCSSDVNHGVLVVGYGKDHVTGLDYWLIKNSWGTNWGENGYYKLAMGRGTGLCGIARQACYPVGVTNYTTGANGNGEVDDENNSGYSFGQNRITCILSLLVVVVKSLL